MRKGRERSNCDCILLFCEIGGQIGIIFLLNWEKNILFGNGNGAEFQPQNRVIESPVYDAAFQQGLHYLLRYKHFAF